MRLALSLLLLGVSGCDVVFGIELPDQPIPDAGAEGIAPIDAIDAPGCPEQAFTEDVLADTMLIPDPSGNCNPANRCGHLDTINIGQQEVGGRVPQLSRVLLRFRLAPEAMAALPLDGVISSAMLRIGVRTSGGACGTGCPNAPTTFQVYAASNLWNQGNGMDHNGAAWCHRMQTDEETYTMWQVLGANGPLDRSQVPLATVDVDAATASTGGGLDIPLSITPQTLMELRAFADEDELSLMLVPTAGGTLFLYSVEAFPNASQLVIRTCT